jgi:hypothetical protein
LHNVRAEEYEMGWRGAKRQLVAAFAVAGCLGIAPIAQAQLFRPFSDRRTALLEGNWQSCREPDGTYAERVYDGKWAGLLPFELHMGPFHEFALYRGIQDDHRDHRSPQNLLKPYVVPVRGNAAGQSWDVEGLHLEVALSGGSREDCESWYVTVRRADSTSVSH